MHEYINQSNLPKNGYERTLPYEIDVINFEQNGNTLRQGMSYIPIKNIKH